MLSYFKNKRLTNPVVVSPDAGGVARAKLFLDALCSDNIGARGSLAPTVNGLAAFVTFPALARARTMVY